MDGIIIDFRFMHVSYELWAMDEYLTIVKANTEKLRLELPTHLSKRMESAFDSYDEGTIAVTSQEVEDVRENILPRFYMNLATLAAYSTLETCIYDIVRDCEKAFHSSLAFKDRKERGLLNRTRAHFLDTMGIRFCRDQGHWENLTELVIVRNCIAHASGKLDLMTARRRVSIEQLVRTNKGLHLTYSDEALVVDELFLDRSQASVRSSVTALLREAKSFLDNASNTP